MQYNEEFWNKYADENESRYNKEFSKYVKDLAVLYQLYRVFQRQVVEQELI